MFSIGDALIVLFVLGFVMWLIRRRWPTPTDAALANYLNSKAKPTERRHGHPALPEDYFKDRAFADTVEGIHDRLRDDLERKS